MWFAPAVFRCLSSYHMLVPERRNYFLEFHETTGKVLIWPFLCSNVMSLQDVGCRFYLLRRYSLHYQHITLLISITWLLFFPVTFLSRTCILFQESIRARKRAPTSYFNFTGFNNSKRILYSLKKKCQLKNYPILFFHVKINAALTKTLWFACVINVAVHA